MLVVGFGSDQIRKLISSNTLHEFKAPLSTDVKSADADSLNNPSYSEARVKTVKNKSDGKTKRVETPAIKLSGLPVKTETDVKSGTAMETTKTAEYPDMLGQLKVENGWIVSRMIATVYGFYNNRYRRLIKNANPHIRNLNRVTAGDVIRFPVVPAESQPLPSMYWVQIGKKGELGEAHSLLQKYSDKLPPMQIFPYWNDREGLKFSILIRSGFADEKSARVVIDKLPPIIFRDAKIVSKWGNDTIFFANLEMADS